jgi:hypothetical protein
VSLLLALLRLILGGGFHGIAIPEPPSKRDMPGYFSPEYRAHLSSARWRAFRFRVLASTLGRDVLFPFLRASQCDHLDYRRLGRERIWLDVVPLHPATHRMVTALRDAGHREAINAALRVACAVWLLAYVSVGVGVVALVVPHAGSIIAKLL